MVASTSKSGSLRKLEDFMALGLNNLVDFLAVGALKTLGRKVELVVWAFSAVELSLPIIQEEQQAKINKEYENRLNKFNICDPLSIEESKRTDITKWPKLDCSSIFAYILKVRDFGVEYVGCYKDQKAYSYWDSGFVSTIYSHMSPQRKCYMEVLGVH
ncbi:Hypothetical predicted protein [Paramuricea clavata]|uniref:Uncharacterized protein n=1 Tax=Paramuricea clavata TaxID=317549 RepID=A0A6S7H3K4_PARCT|nr:Hypothetical predicted protein [Paramuricea clavata]